jgi:hypothetical protein
VSVSRMLDRPDGVRCVASMPSVVEPGAQLGLTFELENTSSRPVTVSSFPPSYPVTVVDGRGTTWDTMDLMEHSWPAEIGKPKLLPGGSKTVRPGVPLAVQFPGPITVRPTCAGERMPTLHVHVDATGPSPPPAEAVARAAEATHGLLDECRPPADGSVLGTIRPPGDAGDVPPMEARCSAAVDREPGFTVVTFVITTPTTAPAVSAPAGFVARLSPPSGRGDAETIVWRFVVTDVARPVASGMAARTTPNGDSMTTEFDIGSKGWSDGDASGCGGDEASIGGDGSSVTVVFLSPCEQRSPG